MRSRSQRVHNLAAALATGPTNADIIARAQELAQAGGGARDEDILAVIREGRDGCR